jgi:hypothetical protein
MCESVQITKRDKSPNIGMVISAFTENLLLKEQGLSVFTQMLAALERDQKSIRKRRCRQFFFMPNLAIEMLR